MMSVARYSTKGLTEHDKALVDKAYGRECYRDCCKVHALMKEAETDKGREVLHLIASDYYHADECECGLL